MVLEEPVSSIFRVEDEGNSSTSVAGM
jgi:hypothetical protein